MRVISKILSVVIKKAMAVPKATGPTAEKMKEQGIHVIQNMLTRMPNTTQKEIMESLKGVIDSGASEFFKGMTPRTVIGLPNIYILDPNDVFEVDGKQYVSITVDPPRKVGQKWTAPSGTQYVKGQDFGGEVTALDLNTGDPVVLQLAPIKDKIIAPTGNREVVMERANKEVSKYNERIKSINNAVGASKLVLQIDRAKQQIQDRLDSLNRIIQGTQKKLDHFQGAPLSAFESYVTDLKANIQSGKMSLKDAYDTILYLYMSVPEKLITDIESGPLSTIPEELKAGILSIARKEVETKDRKEKEKVQEELEREKRIQDKTIPEIHDTEIEPFSLEDIPGASIPGKEKYREISTTKSMWHEVASLKRSLESSTRDLNELTKIKQSIENMEKFMGDLQKGQRSKQFLNTPEGKPILDAMNNFLSEASLFIKRYAIDIIQDGKVNPKLMGSEGTEGNALVAVALTRMYNVTKETINAYTGGTPPTPGAMVEIPSEKELVETPAPTPVSASQSYKNKIKRMSELLWLAFENRGKIR